MCWSGLVGLGITSVAPVCCCMFFFVCAPFPDQINQICVTYIILRTLMLHHWCSCHYRLSSLFVTTRTDNEFEKSGSNVHFEEKAISALFFFYVHAFLVHFHLISPPSC